MSPAALQLPFRDKPSEQVGRRLFRKQVLPVGRIKYRDRVLDFTRDYLAKLRDNFNTGAVDQVPFVLADERNQHTDDPERYRGEVKGFELAPDGLDAIIEMTDRGAQLVAENPNLGASPRIIEQIADWGPKAVPAIAHVCGTLLPHNSGMRNWEAISEFGGSYSADQVVDLTAATYEMAGTDATKNKLSDEQRTALKDAGVPDDKLDAVASIFAETGSEGTDADRTDTTSTETKDDEGKDRRSFLSRLFGREVKEDEVEEIDSAVQALLPDDAETGDQGGERKDEPATANLSAEQKAAIDLATRTAASANSRADRNDQELRKLRFEKRRDELVGKGIDPATVELCKPVLELPDDASVIDLSAAGGQGSFNVRDFVDKVLEQHEDLIDLTGEIGSSAVEDGDAEAATIAERWHKAAHGEEVEDR